MSENTIEQFISLLDGYSEDDFVNYVIATADSCKNTTKDDLVYQYYIIGMVTCLNRLVKEEDSVYYDGFVNIFIEYQSFAAEDHDPEKLINHCMSVVNAISEYEDVYPENNILKALKMDILGKAAEISMQEVMPEAVVAFYEYQRNYLIDHQNLIRDFEYEIARIDMGLITPYILAGRKEDAREIGEEAFSILRDRCQESTDRYAADFIEVCSNFGGIQMDLDELDKAEEIYRQGIAVWEALPEFLKQKSQIMLNKHILDVNMQKLKLKRGKVER